MTEQRPRPVRTPKQSPSYGRRPTPGSKYYAGYGAGFVEDVLDHLDVQTPSVILDPWNGAGTTTQVAVERGMAAIGTDINPALVVIGKSKLLRGDASESREALAAEILGNAKSDTRRLWSDPLTEWFTVGTASYLRAVEQSIQHLLVRPEAGVDLNTATGLREVSALAASFYVVLFETVRGYLADFTTSNPTWMKGGGDEARLSVPKKAIDTRFRECDLRAHPRPQQLLLQTDRPGSAAITLASSTDLPLNDSSAHACITSPPYCTRMDYAILTRPELAALGVKSGDDVRSLRNATIGTTTVWSEKPSADPAWGDYTNALIKQVAGHPSVASKTYYRNYYVQYFDSMYRSLAELRRVLTDDAPCAMVVQDSFYKDIRVDLARSISEMGQQLGWTSVQQTDFEVPWNRARAHPASSNYRQATPATESLLVMRA